MRMWMIEAYLLCQQHLVGEHSELHKHLPSLRKGHSVMKRFDPVVQMQFVGYVERHDEIAIEMIRRGMNHTSPLTDVPDFTVHYSDYMDERVDLVVSIDDLMQRCPMCRARILSYDKFGRVRDELGQVVNTWV